MLKRYYVDTMRNESDICCVYGKTYSSAAKSLAEILFGKGVVIDRKSGNKNNPGLFQAYKYDRSFQCLAETGKYFYLICAE